MIEIYDMPQGSEAWLRARLGLVTMSNAATILAKGKDGGASLTRAKYMRELAAERISGELTDGYTNIFMERGKLQEAEARGLYALCRDVEPELVGFIRNGNQGCSPDALLGTDGMLEVKTRLGHLQIELLLADKFPAEHRAQVQGGLWIAEREYCDLAVYSPGLPLYLSRQYRDEAYIANLAAAVDRFNEELALIVEQIQRYGQTPREFLREQLKASAAS